jgi:uncharacterized protein YjcR
MAHEPRTRQKVRAKYVQGLPLEAAADVCSVSYSTARNWKRKDADDGDDWDIARNAKRISSGGLEQFTGSILYDLAEQFEATIKSMHDAKDIKPQDKANMLLKLSDAYVKAMAAAGRGNPKLNRLSIATEVLKEFNAYIVAKFPPHRAAFIDMLEGFGPVLTKKFGASE